MLMLPRVKKSFKRALTRLESANKVVAAVALGLGIGLGTLPATDVHAAPAVQQSTAQPVGSLLFAAPNKPGDVVADHYSHYSHSSHASHSSHYSHYSSR